MTFRQLTKEERCFIECIISKDLAISVREIARQIGRSPSTISRELKRNCSNDAYQGIVAHSKYISRRNAQR